MIREKHVLVASDITARGIVRVQHELLLCIRSQVLVSRSLVWALSHLVYSDGTCLFLEAITSDVSVVTSD